jgi:hypothetical protein
MIRETIKYKLRSLIKEEIIDGQKMSPQIKIFCNTMSVRGYYEVLGRLIAAIGPKEENPELWAKIEKPLNMLKQADQDLNKEKKIYGMTGDSLSDEANTWWSAIQTEICEQGSSFK